jgi:hypothetical protein
MSQTGYTPISLYYSTTAAAVPVNTNLANGELAINITDGKLYYKDNTGTVKLLAGATAGPAGGSTTQVQYNSSGVLAGSSALTFDGTNLSNSGYYIGTAATGRLTKSTITGRNVFTGGITGGTTDGAYIITEGYDYGGTGLGGQIQLVTAGATSPITFAINGTEGMRLTSTGLGIGTSSPATKLQVNFGDAAGNYVNFVGEGATAGTAIATNWNTGGAYFDIRLGGTSSTYTKFRITSAGALGIGSTPSYGTSGQVLTSGGSGAAPTWTTVSGGSQWTTTGSDIYYTTGSVGIGTTAPAKALEVSTATAAVTEVLRLTSTSGTGYLTYIGFKNPGLGSAVTRIYGGNTGNDGSGKFQVSVTNPSGTEQTIMYSVNNTSDQYTSFSTAGSERMRITGTGNLLVGTTSQLVTNITATITKSQAPSSSSTAWADQLGPLVVYGDFGNGGGSQQQSSALTVVGWASFGAPGALIRGWWSSNGPNLGTPTLQFQVASTGNVTNTNNSYGSLSDARIKENITDATPKLDSINQLRVVNFNLKNDVKKVKQIGLIAQEVKQIFPAMVESDSDDAESMMSVKYSVLVPMLVKAMQEQQAIIESLKARLDAANL